jgi:hypothetical protein
MQVKGSDINSPICSRQVGMTVLKSHETLALCIWALFDVLGAGKVLLR